MDGWLEARVIYQHENMSLATEIITNVFYDMGLKGVVVESPEYEKTDGWVDEVLISPLQYAVIGYFHIDDQLPEKRSFLENKLEHLKEKEGVTYTLVFREIQSKNWTESWKDHFHIQKISDRITVKPTWESYESRQDETVIELDPGMAFGTGSHPTTQLSVRLLEKYLKKGNSILDLGSGSGILLIAAAKMGAGRGLGIDLDEETINISRDNFALNGVDTTVFQVQTGNLTESIHERFDMVVANILPDVILSLLDTVTQVLTPGGILISSGFMEMHLEQITAKMALQDFEILEVLDKERWVAVAGRCPYKDAS